MRLPSSELLRETPPPELLLLVVRGGEHSLAGAVLEGTTGDCWSRHLFFGVSVFGVPGADLVALSLSGPAIRRMPVLRSTRGGDLHRGRIGAQWWCGRKAAKPSKVPDRVSIAGRKLQRPFFIHYGLPFTGR
jgi:hypothetical protein